MSAGAAPRASASAAHVLRTGSSGRRQTSYTSRCAEVKRPFTGHALVMSDAYLSTRATSRRAEYRRQRSSNLTQKRLSHDAATHQQAHASRHGRTPPLGRLQLATDRSTLSREQKERRPRHGRCSRRPVPTVRTQRWIESPHRKGTVPPLSDEYHHCEGQVARTGRGHTHAARHRRPC
jgi:hypothetical protein